MKGDIIYRSSYCFYILRRVIIFMANQIIQSIKTIAQSLVDNAGYDKTRGGFIVGVNSVTNTYSVKVDGITYPIVRAVDDATYNIGDIVKVVIPCNQATQMYISSSILSDNSLGNKIANATTLANDAKQLGLDNQIQIQGVSNVASQASKDALQAKNDASTAKTSAETAQTVADNAQAGVDSLKDTVLGVQTYEYILDGVPIPVHKRKDGTYYYILNDEEVAVAEADLVHDANGELKSYQVGGIYQSLNDISESIEVVNTKIDGFDARETNIYNTITYNSLIARKNARVGNDSLIITNDTDTQDVESLLNYLQLNADSIVIYGNGKDIVTIAKTDDNSGYMRMNGTSLLQAQESRLSTIRLRSADGTGNLALVAGSNGHVSLKEVLN